MVAIAFLLSTLPHWAYIHNYVRDSTDFLLFQSRPVWRTAFFLQVDGSAEVLASVDGV